MSGSAVFFLALLILPPLIAVSLSGADQANPFFLLLRMHDDQEPKALRQTEDDEALFSVRVKWVWDGDGKRIGEYTHRLLKRDSVLPEIDSSLLWFPGEDAGHRQIL